MRTFFIAAISSLRLDSGAVAWKNPEAGTLLRADKKVKMVFNTGIELEFLPSAACGRVIY